MNTRIGAYEAKTKLPELLRRVEAGEQFIITNRGEPVAELRPVTRENKATVREAIALMRALPKVQGVSAKIVRGLIQEGRR